MWQWFIEKSILILISSILLLLIMVLGGRWIEKLVKAITPARWHESISTKAGKVIRTIEVGALIVFIAGLIGAVLSEEGIASSITVETVQLWFLGQGLRIFVIFLIGIGLWLSIDRFVPVLMRHTLVRTKGESREGVQKRRGTLTAIFAGVTRTFIVVIITFTILSELKVPIGPILAGFGVAGIAVGFGAQYLIRDLIAGVFIIFENQYRVGDVARVADVSGLVEEINLRKTVLRDLDGIVHHVPNGEIRVASNYTRHFARVNLDISVSYGTDLDHAIAVINRVGKELAGDAEWGKLIRTEPQALRVDKLGDSGIVIKVLGDVKPMQQWAVAGELRKRIKKAFDEEGIEIPWPHVKIYYGDSNANNK